MTDRTVVALMPMKAHSERVPNKNLRTLCGRPLFCWMLEALSQAESVREIVINTDFASLFLDYAGAEVPADMQGTSFRENLNGAVPASWRKSMYYRYWMHATQHNTPAHYGVVTDKYKLIHLLT